MAEPSRILEGVFAISKPPSLSSAQVLRDLQTHFRESKTFAPLLDDTQRKQAEQDRYQHKRRRRDNDNAIKMGHGGTLDPMATGILIVGIGRGTKHLQGFLGCTKQYDTVVLFGKSTDTYDICGKIVANAPYDQITRGKVEDQLVPFRGNIRQVPPIYSALKINGIKAYDYARSGKELPRELESRDMKVDVCSLIEYYEGNKHEFRWPAEEASAEDKVVAQRLLRRDGGSTVQEGESHKADTTQTAKNEIPDTTSLAVAKDDQGTSQADETSSAQIATKAHLAKQNRLSPEAKAALHTHALPTLSSTVCPAPAARVKLVVSSGFYVRSFAHDLGLALGSFGTMAELIRSRQGDYTLQSPPPDGLTTALTYADLNAGEEVWGPKVSSMLKKWMEDNPINTHEPSARMDDRDRPQASRNYKGHAHRGWNSQDRKRKWDNKAENRQRTLRNSSSPEA